MHLHHDLPNMRTPEHVCGCRFLNWIQRFKHCKWGCQWGWCGSCS